MELETILFLWTIWIVILSFFGFLTSHRPKWQSKIALGILGGLLGAFITWMLI